MGTSLKLIAKELFMAGCKRVPLVGDAIDAVDSIAKSHEMLYVKDRLQQIESNMTSFDRNMRDLVKGEIQQTLQGLSQQNLSGVDFTNHIKNLHDIRQSGWSPALFQGLLERSIFWGELCKNPSHYGSVLDDHQKLDPSKLPVFIDADKTRILELTPFALHSLLARQHDDSLQSNIVTSADVWAFVDGARAKKLGTPSPKVGATISKLGMQFAWVPPGESWLGGGDGKPGTNKFSLKPPGLWCGIYPVTQAEWQAVMGTNPSHFKDNPLYPVESVSFNDVGKFIDELNKRTRGDGLSYRLPTSEEWEYICRGGPLSQDQSKYHFYFAQSKTDLNPNPTNTLSASQANFVDSELKRPSNVDLYLPNPLAIYALHGNVWEWTSSLYEIGSARVIRGGGWGHDGLFCSASVRDWYVPVNAYDYLGFHLLAVPTGEK